MLLVSYSVFEIYFFKKKIYVYKNGQRQRKRGKISYHGKIKQAKTVKKAVTTTKHLFGYHVLLFLSLSSFLCFVLMIRRLTAG